VMPNARYGIKFGCATGYDAITIPKKVYRSARR
jgi:hypothetical protein